MNNKFYLISGPIFALSIMLGTAIGANTGNIKIGVVFGLLGGTIINAIMIFSIVYIQKKK